MKANFKIKKNDNTKTDKTLDASNEEKKDITEEYKNFLMKLNPGWNLWSLRSRSKQKNR